MLAYIALHVAAKAGSSAQRLFTYFFLLSAVFTVFTSNDIVILTLTPIIYYCSKVTQMNPMPFLFGEFLAANICSLVLLIGNPTNIIVGEANHLTFANYSMWMVAVAFIATSSAYFCLWYLYRNELNQTFTPTELNPASAFKDRPGAYFHSTVLLLTLLLLSISPWIGVKMWMICALSAGTCMLHNLLRWNWDVVPVVATKPLNNNYQSLGSNEQAAAISMKSTEKTPLVTAPKTVTFADQSDWTVQISQSIGAKEKLLQNTDIPRSDSVVADVSSADIVKEVVNSDNPFDAAPPTTKKSFLALPWRIVPFVFGMFTLVAALDKSGFIASLADMVIGGIPSGSGFSAVFSATFLLTFITILLCNFINNQPATILLTRVIISDKFLSLPENVRSSGMFAVILGSNLGANFTLIGALAGIMWAKILSDKGIQLSYMDFAKVGFKVMPVVTVASAGFLAIEHLL